MKPIPALAVELPEPDDKMLTAVGYRWPCGCETRGTASPDYMPMVVWAACPAHDAIRDQRQVCPIPREFKDAVYVVERSDATLVPGQVLIAPRVPPGSKL